MPADVTIRLLTDTDLPAYKALRDVGLQHDPEAFTSDFNTASALPPGRTARRNCRKRCAPSSGGSICTKRKGSTTQ